MSSDVLSLPFSAVLGMELAKKALMCMAIDDTIKGVLIKGPPGTAKSVLVRSFSELVPDKEIVNIPPNISDDQLFGGLDFETAIKEGRTAVFEGLLSRADGNYVYVDNINLTEVKVLESLLESIEFERVIIEREGVSSEYPLITSIIATMDPSEMEISDSISDRFDMCVTIFSEKDVQNRVDIINADMEFKKDPISFQKEYLDDNDELVEKIQRARSLLSSVILEDEDIETIVTVCKELNVCGHRGDISAAKVAKTLAALDGRTTISEDDISEALVLCISHRREQYSEEFEETSEDVFEERDDEQEEDYTLIYEVLEDGIEEDLISEDEEDETEFPEADIDEPRNISDSKARFNSIYEKTKEDLEKIDEMEMFRLHEIAGVKNARAPISKMRSGKCRGFKIPRGKTTDPAFDATVRAAAPYQISRKCKGLSIKIEKQDIREKIRTRRNSRSFIFTVDASGSLVSGGMMGVVQNAIRSMLMEGYVNRDRVALITFREKDAEIAVPFTRSVELIADTLDQVPAGGSTPLAKAVMLSKDYATNYLRKHPGEKCYVIFITDGQATMPAYPCSYPMGELKRICETVMDPNIEWIVIDSSDIRYDRKKSDAVKFSEYLGARYIDIHNLGKY